MSKIMNKKWLIALFFLFSGTMFSGNLFAQCENAGTQADMTNCISDAYKKADAELNHTYKLAFKGLNAKAAENLKKAQRAWIIYRDAQCNAEYAKWDGGSGGPAAHLDCLYRLTKLRTAELHKTYAFQ
jgi:uncharacterized protein YecT (DUF1311 family)